METKRVKYFSIALEDKPGELARVARRLKEANVDLAGLWGFGVGQGKARILAVPRNSEQFKQTATKAGWAIQEGTCFQVTEEDRVGVLVETLDRVAGEGINLHAVDAIGIGGRCGCYLWSEEKDVERLGKVLKA